MSVEKSLEALRREIDAIDDSVHDLIMRRAEVVEKVRKLKAGEKVKIRPAREAEIIYRLMQRHDGPFPKRELCRMWRELIVATLSMEGPFSVAVFMPEEGSGYWDLARDQYGSSSPMTGFPTERSVIEAVGSQEATVGIMPLPRHDDPAPWWRYLLNEDADSPKVIARLPFFGTGNVRDRNLEALVICPVAHEPTGRDRSLFAVEAKEQTASSRLEEAFSRVGVSLTSSLSWNDQQKGGGWFYLAETDGFIPAGDDRLSGLGEHMPLARIMALGGYAVPLSDEEMNRSGQDAGGVS